MAIRRFMQAVSCLALSAGGGAAMAQEQAATSTQGLEEIVVTAQRVAQNLQDVPIAVSAFSAAQLRDARIESVRDLAQYTPGLTSSEVNPGEPNFAIRGIGTEGINSNAGGDASVVMFVDGVYIGRGGGSNLNLYDLERVEVLRGPQGTLFGKNVVGGAISLVSRKPDFTENFVGGSVTYGNYDRLELLGRFNYALSDVAAVSGAFTTIDRDGYTRNATTGNRVDDENLWGGRLSVRLAPGDGVDILLSGDYTKQDTLGQPRDNVCNAALDGGIHCVGVDPDPRVVNAVDDGFLKREVGGVSATVTLDSPMGEITSITAWRKADYSHRDAFFSNPINPPAQIESINENIETSEQFSQELRLTSSGGPFEWTLGAFYSKGDGKFLADYEYAYAPDGDLYEGGGVLYDDLYYFSKSSSKSYSLFADASYKLFDRLTIGAGIRYFKDKRTSLIEYAPGTGAEQRAKFDSVDPRVYVSYQYSDNGSIYANVAKGFRSGGFNAAPFAPYDPEKVYTYEIGTKGMTSDGTFSYDIAAFFTKYKDMVRRRLVIVEGQYLSESSNIGEVEVKGIELGAAVRPTTGLTFTASAAYLDSEIVATAATDQVNIAGDRTDYTPKFSITLGANYEFDWAADVPGFVRVDYSYRDKVTYIDRSSFLPSVLPQTSDDIGLLNARIGATFGMVGVELYGQNIANVNKAIDPYQGWANSNRTRPRVIGIKGSVSF